MSEEVLEEQESIEEVVEATEEAESPSVDTESETEEPEYMPNFSYKVKDDEFEFDEFLHGSITSKDQEEAIRDLYTKSRGLEGYKDKLTSKEEEVSKLRDLQDSMVGGYELMKEYRDKGQEGLPKLFKVLGLKDDTILDYAKTRAEEIVKYEQLPEEQREVHDRNRHLEERTKKVESELARIQESSKVQSTQQQDNVVLSVLDRPEYKAVKEAMAAEGKDMFSEVVDLGNRLTLGDPKGAPSIAAVIEQVANGNKHFLELHELRKLNQQPAVQTDIGQKPTLPTVKGNNTAAVIKEVSSMDDLRKLADLALAGI